MYGVNVFFFKQKTAYEMRISDWSSDVCSSDLRYESQGRFSAAPSRRVPASAARRADSAGRGRRHRRSHTPAAAARCRCADRESSVGCRSEEHTSELQSLMRNSYAVFCLKKKNVAGIDQHAPLQSDLYRWLSVDRRHFVIGEASRILC